jgi:RimJ/RimL family protein N-acetyltransferase
MDTFTTRRLVAERLREDHLADLVALHLDVEVSRYLGGVRSPETTRTYLQTNMAHWDRHGFGLWALRTPDGAFVGRAGLRHILLQSADEVEVAYTLKRGAWGHGFAGEITEALVEIGLRRLRRPSLVGLVMLGNTASCRVLAKSGFTVEGRITFHDEECVLHRLSAPSPA